MIRQLVVLTCLLTPCVAKAHENADHLSQVCPINCPSGVSCVQCSGVWTCGSCTSHNVLVHNKKGYWELPTKGKYTCEHANQKLTFCGDHLYCLTHISECPSSMVISGAAEGIHVKSKNGYISLPGGLPMRCPKGFESQLGSKGTTGTCEPLSSTE